MGILRHRAGGGVHNGRLRGACGRGDLAVHIVLAIKIEFRWLVTGRHDDDESILRSARRLSRRAPLK